MQGGAKDSSSTMQFWGFVLKLLHVFTLLSLISEHLELSWSNLPWNCREKFSTYLVHSKGSLISGAVTEDHQKDPAGPDQAEPIQCPVPRTVALPQDALAASLISGSETP